MIYFLPNREGQNPRIIVRARKLNLTREMTSMLEIMRSNELKRKMTPDYSSERNVRRCDETRERKSERVTELMGTLAEMTTPKVVEIADIRWILERRHALRQGEDGELYLEEDFEWRKETDAEKQAAAKAEAERVAEEKAEAAYKAAPSGYRIWFHDPFYVLHRRKNGFLRLKYDPEWRLETYVEKAAREAKQAAEEAAEAAAAAREAALLEAVEIMRAKEVENSTC